MVSVRVCVCVCPSMVCVQAYMGVRTLGVLRKNYLLRAYMGFPEVMTHCFT